MASDQFSRMDQCIEGPPIVCGDPLQFLQRLCHLLIKGHMFFDPLNAYGDQFEGLGVADKSFVNLDG